MEAVRRVEAAVQRDYQIACDRSLYYERQAYTLGEQTVAEEANAAHAAVVQNLETVAQLEHDRAIAEVRENAMAEARLLYQSEANAAVDQRVRELTQSLDAERRKLTAQEARVQERLLAEEIAERKKVRELEMETQSSQLKLTKQLELLAQQRRDDMALAQKT